jgi:DNA-binding CsgD family transcriptional regulator
MSVQPASGIDIAVTEPSDAESLVFAAQRLLAASSRAVGERQRHLLAAQQELHHLQHLSAGPVGGLERTGRWRRLDEAQTHDLVAQLDRTARRENLLLCADAVPPRPTGRHRLPGSRIICDRALLEEPGGDLAIRSLTHDADVRIGRRLNASMRIVDGEHLVVGPLPAAAAYIRSPQVAAALRQLFDLLWEESVPVRRSHPPDRLTPSQWRILQLLAIGLDDPALARVTGTTVKTVRTHVTAVLSALGTATRFAAGAEAVARGWLS